MTHTLNNQNMTKFKYKNDHVNMATVKKLSWGQIIANKYGLGIEKINVNISLVRWGDGYVATDSFIPEEGRTQTQRTTTTTTKHKGQSNQICWK